MKPVAGIDLSLLLQREEDAYIHERAEEILKQIRHVANGRRSAIFMIEAKQKEIDALQERVKKADEKLARIAKGDWSAIDLPIPEAKPQSTPRGAE